MPRRNYAGRSVSAQPRGRCTLSGQHEREEAMARKTVLVSDLSGKEIEDGKGAKVRITFADARSGSLELDVTADEARAMGAKGRQVTRRGRRPKNA
jgi:hypothetical protein